MDALLDTSKTTWDLSHLLSGLDDPVSRDDLIRVRVANQAFADKWKNRTDYLTDAQTLREALDDYETLNYDCSVSGGEFGFYGKAGYYFWLRTQQDGADSAAQAKHQQAIDAVNEITDVIRFFKLSLGGIAPADQLRLLDAPEFSDGEYSHFLKRIFTEARHRLSEPEEKILSLKYATSHNKWVQLRQTVVLAQERQITFLDGEQRQQNFEQLLTLTSDQDKAIRDQAAKALNSILAQSLLVAEAELNAVLANHKVDDELRKFERPDSYRHLADDIDTAVVDTMVETVTARKDISHRFYRLKADLLQLPALTYWERSIEYGSIDQFQYDWNTSCHVVNEVYSDLDAEFGEIFRSFVNSGRFDVYPRVGKARNAFCVRFNKAEPSYVLLNHTNKLDDVIALAHEFGHGLNNEFMRRNQNSLNFGTSYFTAEVASQYLEDFFYDRLLADGDKEMRLAVNMRRLGDAMKSIYRQVYCYRFEQKLHADFRDKGYLSASKIGELFQTEMAAYLGPAVEQPPGAENWWIYWDHIRKFFYNYSYASGLLIAKAMQRKTRQDHDFIAKVKEFLSTGISMSPREIFARMDIDITGRALWNSGLDEVEDLLDQTEKLAISLGKIPSR